MDTKDNVAMSEKITFGAWLRQQRRILDLTQQTLADQTGCARITLRRIEANSLKPSKELAFILLEKLGIPDHERSQWIQFARGLADIPVTQSTPLRIKPRTNVPASVTTFIGREKEIAQVHDYLLNPNIRLVTLMGPPGIGKTRLSVEVARESLSNFPDGIFFIALASLETLSLVAPAIIKSLGYAEARDLPPIKQLTDGIGDKQMILVMDNCEHLIEELAPFISGLLSACFRLKILATSRESLRISGEWLYSVPALDIPKENSLADVKNASQFPALTLFAERARAVSSDFTIDTTNIQAVASICKQLDGLPLAIELIAARMRLMSPQALLEHLSDQFILSANGMRADNMRQKTLQNAIGWSYNLLPPDEQKLFTYLSIFAGGFTMEAVEEIFSQSFINRSVPDLIISLSDKSLIQRTLDEDDEIHYDMLTTIKQFSFSRLAQMGDVSDARERHLTYFLGLAEKGDKEMRGANQIEWLNRFRGMRDNLRASLEWAIESGQTEAALKMVRKLHWFWFVRSDHNEGRQWIERVLALPDAPLHPQPYAEALTQLVHHMWVLPHRTSLQDGTNIARRLAMQALEVARANNDRWNIARALAMLGLVLIEEKDFALAQSTLEECKALFRDIHDDWGYAHSVLCLGFAAYTKGDLSVSLSLNEQALALFREVGDRYFMSVTLRYISAIQMKQGNFTQGESALREAIILSQQLDGKFEIGMALWNGAEAAQLVNKPLRAVHLYWMAKNVYDSMGVWGKEDELKFENNLATCRSNLNELEFSAAVEQARVMTMEQAIQYALEQMK
jgi:predicted ATPase/DNA-binding XRE family transcriptional regulator